MNESGDEEDVVAETEVVEKQENEDIGVQDLREKEADAIIDDWLKNDQVCNDFFV